MPNSIERKSLKTDLVSRYNSQNAGGAFDAKNISNKPGQRSSDGGLGFGIQETQYTTPLFRVASSTFIQQSDFKNNGKDLSIYVQGLDNTKYKA